MALLHWKEQYSVGIDAVDYEHKELIDLINRLHAEFSAKGVSPSVEAFFGDLLKAISAHFALEERFMLERNYDQLAQHKADHERLIDELRDMMDDDFGAEDIASSRLQQRLDAWFSRHFETHDARLHKAFGAHPH
jgi:hemerythrin